MAFGRSKEGNEDGGIPEMTRSTPAGVLIAEAFLMFIMITYFAKICVLSMGLLVESSDGPLPSWNLIFFVIEIAMILITVDAVFGLSSRKPAGWKKAARGSFILLALTILGSLVTERIAVSGLVSLDPLYVMPMVLIVMVALLTPSVRDYYVPPMESRRPLRSWIAFAAFSQLYPKGEYRIAYAEERTEPAPVRKGRLDRIKSLIGRFRSQESTVDLRR